jgi:hypothetical protein
MITKTRKKTAKSKSKARAKPVKAVTVAKIEQPALAKPLTGDQIAEMFRLVKGATPADRPDRASRTAGVEVSYGDRLGRIRPATTCRSLPRWSPAGVRAWPMGAPTLSSHSLPCFDRHLHSDSGHARPSWQPVAGKDLADNRRAR